MAFGLLSVAGVSDVVGGYCVLYARALSVFLVKEEMLSLPSPLLPPSPPSFLLPPSVSDADGWPNSSTLPQSIINAG